MKPAILLLAGLLALAPDARAQPAADQARLMAGYRDAFKVLGRSRICRLDFDAAPFFREVERRHGESSEAMRIARLSFAAGAENLLLPRDIDPTPGAPMPCDVMVYMKDMRLPELP